MNFLFGDCCGPGGHLVWVAPTWLPGVVGACVVIALALASRPTPAKRWAELGLLLIAGVALSVASAGPVWVQEGERVEDGRFVVLVDSSRSMAVTETGGVSRSAAVTDVLGDLRGAEVYHFGDSLAAGPPTAYDLDGSDIGGALAAISARYAGEKLEGIALLSDGLDRGGLRRRLPSEGAAVLPKLGGPLTVYQIGSETSLADVAITDMRGGGFAFLRAPFSIDVAVSARNVVLPSTTVSLTRDGQPVAHTTVKLDADGHGTAHFDVSPDLVGRFIYEATVPAPPEDAVPANNALTLAVRVVRDRLRVLQVCGAPSQDQKFLRLFLKEDPGVDLVSFFILRTPKDFGAGYAPNELALIEFPYERLFSTDLSTFDLVILQNFDWKPYFGIGADTLLQNLADYVRSGHALAMMGGDRSFDLGDWGGTPVADVLPVRLGVTGDSADVAPFTPQLTDDGARHPVTALAADTTENARMWAQLSPLDGLNLSLGPSPGAAVLLSHPSRVDANGQALPVLSVGSYGAGRTLALMGDSSWRWSFAEAGAGRGNQAYLRFWKNAMRWLIADPEDRPVGVDVPRDNYQPGEEVRILAQAREAGFNAAAGAAVRATISGPTGTVNVDGVTGADGLVTLLGPSEVRGAYRVKVVAHDAKGALLGDASTVYAVITRDPEIEEITPDSAFLRSLASAAGGKYVAAGERALPLRDADSGRRVRERKEAALYAAPILPLVFGLCASMSWWLRRRSGLR